MFWCILSSLVYLLLALVVIVILKELIPFIRYKILYAPQGMKYHYSPIGGWTAAALDLSPQTKDVFGNMKANISKKYKDEKIIVFNEYDTIKNMIVLNDPDLIKDYFLKENECVKRIEFLKNPVSLGFFFENGDKALAQRAIFNEFFQPKNLELITPKIEAIIVEKINSLKKKLFGDEKKADFKLFELHKWTPDLFNDIVNEILFGSKEFPVINGLKLPEATDEFMTL